MQPEYLELPEATDPTSSFRVSVTLQGGAMICKRDICLLSFLNLMNGQQYEMTFDEHPYAITRFDVDIVKRLVKIFGVAAYSFIAEVALDVLARSRLFCLSSGDVQRAKL